VITEAVKVSGEVKKSAVGLAHKCNEHKLHDQRKTNQNPHQIKQQPKVNQCDDQAQPVIAAFQSGLFQFIHEKFSSLGETRPFYNIAHTKPSVLLHTPVPTTPMLLNEKICHELGFIFP